ncbi:hypothetical protein MGG_07443 [Pyricularia oryzae 70-15]|uniref:NAD(P)-binding protein n=3 Tax=Pyricularia oryzae TaxID=318829 RepID=G4N154_PYRO7|nr:uncharacterized protein MGG_07443 [Pyricularia oryzae 70-15]EHA51533.1 hypothetical protein MGG_07443 [Pyricularia oryzae 70-15]KAI7919245.1 hypothetical protein M9X92_006466 [Pyricularia oryzae]KAI7923572.1 hypothetical protein M0657_005037 [Pyricularia oryzae]
MSLSLRITRNLKLNHAKITLSSNTQRYRKMSSLIPGSNTFNPDKDIPDLSGKHYIVTGGSAGIGFGIAAHLLQHKADNVTILSNKEEHAQSALEELKEYGDASKAHWVKCDFEDLKFTEKVANELARSQDKLDGLVLNAGLGVGVYNETKDKIDSHFQVNILSQFLLLKKLLPRLQKTPGARLVFESSDLHKAADGGAQFKDEAEINNDIGPTQLYNRTKLALILLARALQRRKEAGELGFQPGQSVFINAVHPGAVATDQQLQAEEAYGTLGVVGHAIVRPFLKDPVSQGCRPALFATTSKEIEEQEISGQYIVPDKKVTSPSSKAQDDELGERLWNLMEQMLKDRLG